MEQREIDVSPRRGCQHHEIGVQVSPPCGPRPPTLIDTPSSELPTYELVVPALLTHGLSGLRTHCKLTPGVPLKPMLAKPTKAIGEVLDRFEGRQFTCEYKYDGERAQVHMLEDGSVSVFSRNSEDMKAKYPDLVEQLPRVGNDLYLGGADWAD